MSDARDLAIHPEVGVPNSDTSGDCDVCWRIEIRHEVAVRFSPRCLSHRDGTTVNASHAEKRRIGRRGMILSVVVITAPPDSHNGEKETDRPIPSPNVSGREPSQSLSQIARHEGVMLGQ